MGFLDRFSKGVVKGVNKVDEAVSDAGQAVRDVTFNRPYVRGERMMREGDTAIGRIVGVRRKYNGDTTRSEVAVAYDTGSGLVRSGVQVRPPGAVFLRFGMDVPLRLDGKGRAVLDTDVLDPRFGLTSSTLLWVEPSKHVPDDGIDESAQDSRVAKRLRNPQRVAATIVDVTRRTAMGMLTENFDVTLALADGRSVTDPGQEVPFYARWLVRPGEVVSVALSADDPTRATVDWAATALSARDRAGSFEDDTPPI